MVALIILLGAERHGPPARCSQTHAPCPRPAQTSLRGLSTHERSWRECCGSTRTSEARTHAYACQRDSRVLHGAQVRPGGGAARTQPAKGARRLLHRPLPHDVRCARRSVAPSTHTHTSQPHFRSMIACFCRVLIFATIRCAREPELTLTISAHAAGAERVAGAAAPGPIRVVQVRSKAEPSSQPGPKRPLRSCCLICLWPVQLGGRSAGAARLPRVRLHFLALRGGRQPVRSLSAPQRR